MERRKLVAASLNEFGEGWHKPVVCVCLVADMVHAALAVRTDVFAALPVLNIGDVWESRILKVVAQHIVHPSSMSLHAFWRGGPSDFRILYREVSVSIERQRLTQRGRINGDHLNGASASLRGHEDHRRNPVIHGEGNAFDQFLVGFDAIVAGGRE